MKVSNSISTFDRDRKTLWDEFIAVQHEFVENLPPEAQVNSRAIMVAFEARDETEAMEHANDLILATLRYNTDNTVENDADGDEYFTCALRDVLMTGLLAGRAVERSVGVSRNA